MKKVIAIILAFVCVVSVFTIGASAAGHCVVLDSKPKSYDDAMERSIFGVEVPTGKTVTARLYSTGGAQIKVPAGGHAEWYKKHLGADENGLVKLTPSADGNSCMVKGIKGGRVYVGVKMYDKNGKLVSTGESVFLDKGNILEWATMILTLGLYGVNVVEMFKQDIFSTVSDLALYYFNLVLNPGLIM